MSAWVDARKLSKCGPTPIPEADRLFWLGQGGSPLKGRSFCLDCPIIDMCKNYAIVHDEEGIWGGTTKKERDEILAEMPQLREILTERARQEGWLEEHRWEPIVALVFYQETTQYQSDEDELFDRYLNTLPQTGS